MTTNTRILSPRLFAVASAMTVMAAVFPGQAIADDPDAVPAAILNTHCSTDQLMAATKVVDPKAYSNIVTKYSQEPQWFQGTIHSRMDALLDKDPADRQSEVDEFARAFPQYAGLFQTQEWAANAIAAKCPSYPAEDPAVWNS